MANAIDSLDPVTRADAYELDGEKLDEVAGDCSCLHSDEWRAALVAVMAGNVEPMKSLMRRRAEKLAEYDIREEREAKRQNDIDVRIDMHIENARERRAA